MEKPPQHGSGPVLAIEMDLETTLTPKMIHSGAVIGFFDEAGKHILTYRDLKEIDATGQKVPAWLSLSDETSSIAINIDDASSTHPLYVDPLIVTEEKKLIALAQNGKTAYSALKKIGRNLYENGIPYEKEIVNDEGVSEKVTVIAKPRRQHWVKYRWMRARRSAGRSGSRGLRRSSARS